MNKTQFDVDRICSSGFMVDIPEIRTRLSCMYAKDKEGESHRFHPQSLHAQERSRP